MTLGKSLNRSVRLDAETIAIEALSFLAERPEDLARFLSLSGVDPSALRRLAGDSAFLEGILDYLLGDEPLLLAFAETKSLSPADIAQLRTAQGPGA